MINAQSTAKVIIIRAKPKYQISRIYCCDVPNFVFEDAFVVEKREREGGGGGGEELG